MNTRLEDEVTEQEWFQYYTKPIVIIVVAIMALFSKSIGPVIFYISVYLFMKGVFLILTSIHFCKNIRNKRLQEKRTKCIVAEIKQIKIVPEVEYDELQILCEVNEDDIKASFRCKTIKSVTEYKIGDKINVMIEPNNYNNYLVMLDNKIE